ncbi:succinate CoA transferase [Saccharicrinis aurantiacus]|uniref:succinate CoA transferase n=1 Tax=Saccharicrinis aurantiacus TaxID=1849719 RepID=UPI00094F6FC7|nr:succinate CoA transferase [Saccharicrinis aurantiacus]
MSFKKITPEEAASYIHHDATVAFSGFTPAGSPKVVPAAIAAKAEKEHEAGREFKIGVISGASTGDSLDGKLARANAVKFRTPYQSNKDLRNAINSGEVEYFDMHLSALAQEMRYGFFGDIDVAIIEAADVSPNGEVVLTSGVGISPTAAKLAKRVIIELNTNHPAYIKGLHDIYEPLDPPYRKSIPVHAPDMRIGDSVLRIDPAKIMGIVENNAPDETGGFAPVDEVTAKIGDNVASFLAGELRKGTIPEEFLPIQSGVGNIANAVLGSLGSNEDIPPFKMYTEVIQESVIELMKKGDITFASGCSLTVSPPVLDEIYKDYDFFKDKLVLRPQEISNNPELVRQLGLITINTAIEADIFGNINSTHILGTKMMNGIGGSGDFTRNSFLSIFTCPSVAKGGAISAIVPLVSHQDHSEHSVKVLITEQGVADLRGKSPRQRAETIIENCVHPDYKDLMRDYLAQTDGEPQTPQALKSVFNMHSEFLSSGDMRKTKW